ARSSALTRAHRDRHRTPHDYHGGTDRCLRRHLKEIGSFRPQRHQSRKDRILPGPLRPGASRSALTLRTISWLTCHVNSRLHRRLLSILVMSTMRSLSYFKWGGCNSLVASANGRGIECPFRSKGVERSTRVNFN